jgi:hypothetical protein
MDQNESDAVMLAMLGELRTLRPVLSSLADTMLVVNQTCVRVAAAVDQLSARVALLQDPAE